MAKQKHDIGYQKRLKNKAEKKRLKDLELAKNSFKKHWKENR